MTTQRIAAAIVRLLAPAVPASFRARWREEWLAEIDESAPGRRLIWRAAGAWRDVLACRRHSTPAAPETAAFGLRGLGDDLRHSVRAIRRSPGFTFAAVASLSIGIAATTTVFSAVNALLFRSLPGVQDSARLVHVFTVVPAMGLADPSAPESSLQHYRETLSSLSAVAGFAQITVAIGTSAEPRVGRAVLVTPNYFELLGTAAAAGRLIGPDAGTQSIAVVSHELAVREFTSAAAALGRTLSVNGLPLEIVGVTPPSFVGIRAGGFGEGAGRPQVWLARALRPLVVPQREELMNRGPSGEGSWLEVVGRLASGISVDEANVQAASAPAHPIFNGRHEARARVGPLGRGPRDTTAMVATMVALALGIPFIVLAIGCANTANLQLARAAQRQTEIAVKRSLGATRGVIVRQLLIESVFVAALAGALAVVGTMWATRVLDAYMPVPCPVDWRVLVFALGVVLVTGVGFGMAPALTSTRGSLTAPLKDSGANAVHSRSRLRGALVVAQVTLSILLLVMAGLFTRSLQNLQGVGTDRDMSHVAAATLDLGLLKYPESRGRVFQQELLARIERAPGVVAAAIAPFEPFGGNPGLTYRTEDHTGSVPYLYTNGGAPLGRFVETAGLRVIRGRGFVDADRAGTPRVALVSEALARRMSPSGEVVGRRLLVADGEMPKTDVTIVGITADSALRAIRGETHAMFLPSPLNYDAKFTLWVRTSGDPSLALPATRQIVRDLDPQLPILRLGTADHWRAGEIQPVRWIASGLGAMGMVAVLLAGAGLYAVMSYLVSSRRHEMAVRLALGATPSDLARLIVGQALRLSAPGLALGALMATIAARIARAMLFGVSPLDPIAFGGVAVLLTAVAVVATLVPALRAARLDPLATLRRQ